MTMASMLLSALVGAAALVAPAAAFGQHCKANTRAVVRGEPVYNGPLVPNLKVRTPTAIGMGALA
jgi:hypothetical protein